MKIELIHTERLTLQVLSTDVYDQIYADLSKKEIMDFLGHASDKEYQLALEKYNNGLTSHNRSLLYFQIIENESDQIIGGCGFHNWCLDHDRAELGYALDSAEHMGKGYMSEAIREVIDYGFNILKLHRIEALVGPSNEASLKIIHKFNFTKEGHMREHYLRNGVYEDSLVFSLLHSEYNS